VADAWADDGAIHISDSVRRILHYRSVCMMPTKTIPVGVKSHATLPEQRAGKKIRAA
jgi:hypothetical protein